MTCRLTPKLRLCSRLQLPSLTNAYLVVLSARQRILDAIGEPVAADEFIADPISPRDLVTRLRAMLRRPDRTTSAIRRSSPSTIQQSWHRRISAGCDIDFAHRHAVLGGTALSLTRIEFDILAALASRPGSVFTRQGNYSRQCGVNRTRCAHRASQSTSEIFVASSATTPPCHVTSSPCGAADTVSRNDECEAPPRARQAKSTAAERCPQTVTILLFATYRLSQ